MKLAWIIRLVIAALAVALLAPAVSAGAGESDEDVQEGTTYVGTVEGTDAYIGIVVGKKAAFGYVCDGGAITHWLRGTNKKGEVTLGAQTGASVVAELTDDVLTGTVLLPGNPSAATLEEQVVGATSHTFEAVEATGDAGLFREEQEVDGTTFAAGWVVLEDGSLRGEVTVAADAGDETTTTTEAPTTTAPPSTTAPPATTTPPTTAPPPTNPGGVQPDVGVENVGQIAPPDIQALFPPTPRSGNAVTTAPLNTRACKIAAGQYNLAVKKWGDAGYPGSGPLYDQATAAGENFAKKCGLASGGGAAGV